MDPSPALPGRPAAARPLRPGQRARLLVAGLGTAPPRLVHETTGTALEAPNWTPDGRELVYNQDGLLHRLPADGSAPPRHLDTRPVTDANNDHVLAPDGRTLYFSAGDGHIHAVPLGGGPPRRVTADPHRRHYVHGVSPDGGTLVLTGVDEGPRGRRARLFTVPAAGGAAVRLTDGPGDDGPEFAPDGTWIYFNAQAHGADTAQIHRVRPDGTAREQLTFDERVNWFPHPSPDGTRLLYLSYPPGTRGHPADRDVVLRLTDAAAAAPPVDVLRLFGGQGTLNVPSWAPDGTRFACVAYPLG